MAYTISVTNLKSSKVTVRATIMSGVSRAITIEPTHTVQVDRDIVIAGLQDFIDMKNRGLIWFDENEATIGGGGGSTGLAGPTGPAGGPQGVTGLPGPQGTTGAGVRGATGVAGLQGQQGVTGPAGSGGGSGGGATGLPGPTGAAGAPGSQGVTGVAGNGSTGLPGPTGAAGAPGAQGTTGVDGSGSTGLPGPTGIQGIQGAQGNTGLGTTGPQGDTGYAGTRGFTGAVGLQGTTGFQGFTGLSGSTGPAGGPQGATGLPGPAGGEVTQWLSFYSGNVLIMATGTAGAISGITAVKDFSVSLTSKLILTIPSGAFLKTCHVVFTAAETVGRTVVTVEMPEPFGSTAVLTSVRPLAIRWSQTSTLGGAAFNSTITNTAGTLDITMTSYTGGSDQKLSLFN